MSDEQNEAYLRRVQEYFARRDSSRRCSPNSRPSRVIPRRTSPEQQQQPPRNQSEPPHRRIPNNQTEHETGFDEEDEREHPDWNADRTENRVIPDIAILQNEEEARARAGNDVDIVRNINPVQGRGALVSPVVPLIPAANPTPAAPTASPVAPSLQRPPYRSPQSSPRSPHGNGARPSYFTYNSREPRSVSAHRLASRQSLSSRPIPPGNRPGFNRYSGWEPSSPQTCNLAVNSAASRPAPPRGPPSPVNSTASRPAPPRGPPSPVNSNATRPAPPRGPPSHGPRTRESYEHLNRQGRERQMRNFPSPVRNFGVVPENGQRQLIQASAPVGRTRSATPTARSVPVADQSTWVEDAWSEPVDPWADPADPETTRPRRMSPDEELLLNVNEPTLASSGEAFEPVTGSTPGSTDHTVNYGRPRAPLNLSRERIETGNQQRIQSSPDPWGSTFPEAVQQQHQVPRQQSQQFPQAAPPSIHQHAVGAPNRQPSAQRPLSHHLVSARSNLQPGFAPTHAQARENMNQPHQRTHQSNREVVPPSARLIPEWNDSPRIPQPTPSRAIAPVHHQARRSPTPQRPQSSTSNRQPTQQLWDNPVHSVPQSRNNSIPEIAVARMTQTSQQTQRNAVQRQPEIVRAIQNLPDMGLQDITDIWGFQNETTAAFEPTANFGRASSQAPRPQSILIRRENDIPAEQIAINQQEVEAPYINTSGLTSESMNGMSEAELGAVVDALYYGSPREKYKETYPFLAEGVVQKDSQVPTLLKVFSSRVGKIMIQDSAARGNKDYVYFIVAKEGDYRGFAWDYHPRSLVSAKFPSEHKIVIRGYAILGFANFSKSATRSEGRWICWNDSMGLMSIVAGAARTSLKKHPVWDRQLDIVSISSSFENNRFVVVTLVALTNVEEKKKQFPEEVFLVQDMIFRSSVNDDLIFYSPSLDLTVSLKSNVVDDFDCNTKRQYEIVVVPTFINSTRLEFRGILLIADSVMFWSRDKEWVREKLLKRTEAYKADFLAQQQQATSQPAARPAPNGKFARRTASSAFPPRSK